MTVYMDSCIVIYLVEGMSPWNERVRALLKEKPTICTSDLVRLECLVKPFRQGDKQLEKAFRRELKKMTLLDMAGVHDKAARLRAEFRLNTIDALHLATAIEHRCDEFWTNDMRLAKASPNLTIRAFGPTTAI